MAIKKSTCDLFNNTDGNDYYTPMLILACVFCFCPSKDLLKCVGCLKVCKFHLLKKTSEAHKTNDVNMSESSLAYTCEF